MIKESVIIAAQLQDVLTNHLKCKELATRLMWFTLTTPPYLTIRCCVLAQGPMWIWRTKRWLEWTSSHQCTSCGWARWGRFSDEWKSHPPYMHIFFSHLFSSPKFSPSYLAPTSPLLPTIYLPPPTYHLPPPSYLPPTNPSPPSLHRQSSRDVERERAWSRGAWSSELGARERLEPERDPGKHLTFFSLVYFVCLFVELHCIRYAVLQRNSTRSIYSYGAALQCSIAKKATLRYNACFAALQRSGTKEGDDNNAATAFFFLLWSCAAQLHEEGDGSCRRLLLPGVELRCSAAPRRRQRQLLSPSFAWCGPAALRSSTKKATTTAVAFFSLLWSCVAA